MRRSKREFSRDEDEGRGQGGEVTLELLFVVEWTYSDGTIDGDEWDARKKEEGRTRRRRGRCKA